VINSAYPLTGPLNISSQATIVRPGQSSNEACTLGQLTTAISNEANARSLADQTLQDNINSEETSRIAADNGLQDNIDQLSDQVWKRYPLFNDKTISTYNA